jgi:hypothetical protein
MSILNSLLPSPSLLQILIEFEDDEIKSTSFPVRYDYDDRVENRPFNIDPLLQEVFDLDLYLPVF